MSHPILYALYVVYMMVCIALFAFLGMAIVTSDGFGSRLSIMAIPFVPLWPLAIPFYAYLRYQSWVRDTEVQAEKQRLSIEQAAKAYDDQQRAKLNAEMYARMEAETKAKEASEAAARETQVVRVTEAKTAATTVPTEPAAAPATEPAK